MSNILLKLQEEFDENPFVSFDSSGQGVSKVYDDRSEERRVGKECRL